MPVALGVYVSEHADWPVPLGESVHTPPDANAPLPLLESVTFPVGDVGLAAVSRTVTEQLVGVDSVTVAGEQLTVVVVGSGGPLLTDSVVLPLLIAHPGLPVAPAYAAVIV